MAATLEIELKLEIATEAVKALLASEELDGQLARGKTLTSVYFDTEAHDLRAAGFSLRVRHIGKRRIQTVKADGAAAAAMFVRPEWEQDIPDDFPVLDERAGPLARAVRAATLARVAPLFSTSVTRRTAMIRSGDAEIELVLDRGTITAGAVSAKLCELELELKRGSTAELFALARRLDASAPLRLGVQSKSERGYRLAEGGERPAKAQPVALGETMTAAEAFEAVAGSCIRQFRLNEDALAKADDPRALHQARVGIRRLRSAFSLFKPILDDDRFEHLRGELRWLAAMLGEARNLDVLVARFGDDATPAALSEARRAAYAEVGEALASARLRALMLDLAEWLSVGAWRVRPNDALLRDTPVERFAAEVLDRYRKRVKRRGKGLLTLDDEARHALRIEGKKLRYAAEFFASLYTGKNAARRIRSFRAALETLQDSLGELNDAATAPEVLARLGLAADPAVLAATDDPRRRRDALDAAAEAYEILIETKRFWR